ncbi:excinuclease ABC subunit A [Sinirhodobacter ferrireducens]|uniref:Excinuclease ABC subunit A n=1 Tax=Paenirhodobacter ferrireducens TaxID=1215032 RepID=A0A443LVG2_9RHOB|nr:excinuclease ABC subunit A [Sinirhodobacter ferrireducens]
MIHAQAPGCPPGLAKKNNGCMPPGQAKKWQRGDRIVGDYIVIHDPDRYHLDRRYTYWRSGDYIYRVEPQTGKVLNLIGAVSALLN